VCLVFRPLVVVQYETSLVVPASHDVTVRVANCLVRLAPNTAAQDNLVHVSMARPRSTTYSWLRTSLGFFLDTFLPSAVFETAADASGLGTTVWVGVANTGMPCVLTVTPPHRSNRTLRVVDDRVLDLAPSVVSSAAATEGDAATNVTVAFEDTSLRGRLLSIVTTGESVSESVVLGDGGELVVVAADRLALALQSVRGGVTRVSAERGVVRLADHFGDVEVDLGTRELAECAAAQQLLAAALNASANATSATAAAVASISDFCLSRGGDVHITSSTTYYPFPGTDGAGGGTPQLAGLPPVVRLNASEPSGVICAAGPGRSIVSESQEGCGSDGALAFVAALDALSSANATSALSASPSFEGLSCSMVVDLCDAASLSTNASEVRASSCATTDLYGGALPPVHTYTVRTVRGGVYAALMRPGATSVQSYAVADGGAFAGDVSFDPATLRVLRTLQSWIDSVPGTDALVSLDLVLQSAGLWAFASREVFLQLEPQWLAAFSLGMLVPRFRALDGRLHPGFCPVSALQAAPEERRLALEGVDGELLGTAQSGAVSAAIVDNVRREVTDNSRTYVAGQRGRGELFSVFDVGASGGFSRRTVRLSANVPLIIAIALSMVLAAIFWLLAVLVLGFLARLAKRAFYGYLLRQRKLHELENSVKRGPAQQLISIMSLVSKSNPPTSLDWNYFSVATYAAWLLWPRLQDSLSMFVRATFNTPRRELSRRQACWLLCTCAPFPSGVRLSRRRAAADLLLGQRPHERMDRASPEFQAISNALEPLSSFHDSYVGFCRTYGLGERDPLTQLNQVQLKRAFGVRVETRRVPVVRGVRFRKPEDKARLARTLSKEMFTGDPLQFFLEAEVEVSGVSSDWIGLAEFTVAFRDFCRARDELAPPVSVSDLEAKSLTVDRDFDVHYFIGMQRRGATDGAAAGDKAADAPRPGAPTGTKLPGDGFFKDPRAPLDPAEWLANRRAQSTSVVGRWAGRIATTTTGAASRACAPCRRLCCPAPEGGLTPKPADDSKPESSWQAVSARYGSVVVLSLVVHLVMVVAPAVPAAALVTYMQTVLSSTVSLDASLYNLNKLLYAPWQVFDSRFLLVNWIVLGAFSIGFVAVALIELFLHHCGYPVISPRNKGRPLLDGKTLGPRNGLTLQETEALLARTPGVFPIVFKQSLQSRAARAEEEEPSSGSGEDRDEEGDVAPEVRRERQLQRQRVAAVAARRKMGRATAAQTSRAKGVVSADVLRKQLETAKRREDETAAAAAAAAAVASRAAAAAAVPAHPTLGSAGSAGGAVPAVATRPAAAVGGTDATSRARKRAVQRALRVVSSAGAAAQAQPPPAVTRITSVSPPPRGAPVPGEAVPEFKAGSVAAAESKVAPTPTLSPSGVVLGGGGGSVVRPSHVTLMTSPGSPAAPSLGRSPPPPGLAPLRVPRSKPGSAVVGSGAAGTAVVPTVAVTPRRGACGCCRRGRTSVTVVPVSEPAVHGGATSPVPPPLAMARAPRSSFASPSPSPSPIPVATPMPSSSRRGSNSGAATAGASATGAPPAPGAAPAADVLRGPGASEHVGRLMAQVSAVSRLRVASLAQLRDPVVLAFLDSASPLQPISLEKPYTGSQRCGYLVRWMVHELLRLYLLLVCGAMVAYIVLVGVWWILGAVINPNRFLPYAAAVVTFFTFMTGKIAQLSRLRYEAEDMITAKVSEIVTKTLSSSPLLQKAGVPKESVAKALADGDVHSLVAGLAKEKGQDALGKAMKMVAQRTGIDLSTQLALVRGGVGEDAMIKLAEEKLRIDPVIAKLIISFAKQDRAGVLAALPDVAVHVSPVKDRATVDRVLALGITVYDLVASSQFNRARLTSAFVDALLSFLRDRVPEDALHMLDVGARLLAQPSSDNAMALLAELPVDFDAILDDMLGKVAQGVGGVAAAAAAAAPAGALGAALAAGAASAGAAATAAVVAAGAPPDPSPPSSPTTRSSSPRAAGTTSPGPVRSGSSRTLSPRTGGASASAAPAPAPPAVEASGGASAAATPVPSASPAPAAPAAPAAAAPAAAGPPRRNARTIALLQRLVKLVGRLAALRSSQIRDIVRDPVLQETVRDHVVDLVAKGVARFLQSNAGFARQLAGKAAPLDYVLETVQKNLGGFLAAAGGDASGASKDLSQWVERVVGLKGGLVSALTLLSDPGRSEEALRKGADMVQKLVGMKRKEVWKELQRRKEQLRAAAGSAASAVASATSDGPGAWNWNSALQTLDELVPRPLRRLPTVLAVLQMGLSVSPAGAAASLFKLSSSKGKTKEGREGTPGVDRPTARMATTLRSTDVMSLLGGDPLLASALGGDVGRVLESVGGALRTEARVRAEDLGGSVLLRVTSLVSTLQGLGRLLESADLPRVRLLSDMAAVRADPEALAKLSPELLSRLLTSKPGAALTRAAAPLASWRSVLVRKLGPVAEALKLLKADPRAVSTVTGFLGAALGERGVSGSESLLASILPMFQGSGEASEATSGGSGGGTGTATASSAAPPPVQHQAFAGGVAGVRGLLLPLVSRATSALAAAGRGFGPYEAAGIEVVAALATAALGGDASSATSPVPMDPNSSPLFRAVMSVVAVEPSLVRESVSQHWKTLRDYAFSAARTRFEEDRRKALEKPGAAAADVDAQVPLVGAVQTMMESLQHDTSGTARRGAFMPLHPVFGAHGLTTAFARDLVIRYVQLKKWKEAAAASGEADPAVGKWPPLSSQLDQFDIVAGLDKVCDLADEKTDVVSAAAVALLGAVQDEFDTFVHESHLAHGGALASAAAAAARGAGLSSTEVAAAAVESVSSASGTLSDGLEETSASVLSLADEVLAAEAAFRSSSAGRDLHPSAPLPVAAAGAKGNAAFLEWVRYAMPSDAVADSNDRLRKWSASRAAMIERLPRAMPLLLWRICAAAQQGRFEAVGALVLASARVVGFRMSDSVDRGIMQGGSAALWLAARVQAGAARLAQSGGLMSWLRPSHLLGDPLEAAAKLHLPDHVLREAARFLGVPAAADVLGLACELLGGNPGVLLKDTWLTRLGVPTHLVEGLHRTRCRRGCRARRPRTRRQRRTSRRRMRRTRSWPRWRARTMRTRQRPRSWCSCAASASCPPSQPARGLSKRG
jgi:hypothetical protein